MQKRIVILVVFLIGLCLILMGCSNNASGTIVNTETTPVDESQDMNFESDTPSNDGYLYTVRGHEIKLSVNLEDYMTKKQTATFFDIEKLASHFGFTKSNHDGVYAIIVDDKRVDVGFQHYQNSTTELLFNTKARGIFRAVYNNYNVDKMEYCYYTNYPVSYEFIVLCAKIMEDYSVEYTGNPMKGILDDYWVEATHCYVLPEP